jgi:hypothetical protein
MTPAECQKKTPPPGNCTTSVGPWAAAAAAAACVCVAPGVAGATAALDASAEVGAASAPPLVSSASRNRPTRRGREPRRKGDGTAKPSTRVVARSSAAVNATT